MVGILAKTDAVVQCGAPNLAFLSSTKVGVSQLPYHRSVQKLNPAITYVVLQTNEGDTPKNAYGFKGGNWLSPKRGSLPIRYNYAFFSHSALNFPCNFRALSVHFPRTFRVCSFSWGVSPIQAERFPLLWEYYVLTASANDQFFAATGGVGYTYPWALPDLDAFFRFSAHLYKQYMPQPGNWVDVWEGGLNRQLYSRYLALSNGSIGGFSQQPSTGHDDGVNEWLEDGTPLFLCDKRLWYPMEKQFCNLAGTLDEISTCYAQLIANVSAAHGHAPMPLGGRGSDGSASASASSSGGMQRADPYPYFVLVYGSNGKAADGKFTLMIDIVSEAMSKLPVAKYQAIGTQDAALLGRH
jgi:hypothetical protein